ncbi:MAG TPA: ribonuclease Z [Microvirga sp.]|nr:ribonuclease Z [Microvirga sp.]
MSWLVQPRLINGPFDDPGLFLDFRFGRRAILFDCGDLAPLSSRELMRVSDVFVSHTHMDHFGGFDRLLRVCLHRSAPLTLVGPEGFIDQVEHRIRSYTWNLIGLHSADFSLRVGEFAHGRIGRAASFAARQGFSRAEAPCPDLPVGVVLQEEAFRVEAAALDHGIPSLAFCLRETLRVNVWRGALERLGLPVGPWLGEAKRAVRQGLPADTVVAVDEARRITLGDLAAQALRIGPGQVVAYVTDAAATAANEAAILALARGADQLFIEAVFLDRDRALAVATHHLTAADAGRLARLAGAKHLNVFHYSARYLDAPAALEQEALAAYRTGAAPAKDDVAAQRRPPPR